MAPCISCGWSGASRMTRRSPSAGSIKQPDFAAEQAEGNLSFRIPTRMFGMSLIDAIQDREILSRHEVTAEERAALAITGHPNHSGNDGTITRFGWKAQNKSIPMFAGEAYKGSLHESALSVRHLEH
jgi:CxxC motif-containing protein (DUF1111 family)